MKNTEKTMRVRTIGEPSSKYGYDRTGEQFENDMQMHKERGDFLWNEFVEFMKSHDATPVDFRLMFSRYHDEFLT